MLIYADVLGYTLYILWVGQCHTHYTMYILWYTLDILWYTDDIRTLIYVGVAYKYLNMYNLRETYIDKAMFHSFCGFPTQHTCLTIAVCCPILKSETLVPHMIQMRSCCCDCLPVSTNTATTRSGGVSLFSFGHHPEFLPNVPKLCRVGDAHWQWLCHYACS